MEYQPVPSDHDDAFEAVISYAFSPERGPDPDRDGPDRPDSFRPRALYDVGVEGSDADSARDAADPAAPEDLPADDMTVVCGYYAFSARIRDTFRGVAGVSAVASSPAARRQGLVRELLTKLHRELREEGIDFAALWPFEFSFYRRLGYARIGDYARITVAPDALASACNDSVGSYERLDADDWTRLDEVYADWADGDFGLDRTEDWWRYRVFESWATDPYVYGWVDDTDTLRSYLVYTIEDDDSTDGKTMTVSEFAYRDRRARNNLLRFCRNHDSQVDRVRFDGPADTRLFDELDDPRAAETEVRPGPMARIVDVVGALEGIDYPTDVESSVRLDVADDTCAWNDGHFLLDIADGDGRVESVEGSLDAAVKLDIGALSRLAVGSHDVERLIELGDVVVDGEAQRASLASAFPPTGPFLREGF